MAEWPQIEEGRETKLKDGRVKLRLSTRHKGKLLRTTVVAKTHTVALREARAILRNKVEARVRRMIRKGLER